LVFICPISSPHRKQIFDIGGDVRKTRINAGHPTRAIVITVAVVAVMAASTMSVRPAYAVTAIEYGQNPPTGDPHNIFAPTGQPQQAGPQPNQAPSGQSCTGDPHSQFYAYNAATGQSVIGQCPGAR